jgi:site-specific DNA recombinase
MAVALYARVSTTRQAEQDLSIPDQLRQMRDWAAQHGHLVAVEYVEPGASAMDDRRPVFQEMIADATRTPAPFNAIVIHSLSRFFRDVVSFGIYERRLAKHGVKIIAITQQTTEDATGELARRIFSAFDEYQSKENAKHTSRAMRENARRGYFNGSKAPFGYRVVETEALGNRGRRKRKLAIDEAEAATVRRIYQLYLSGLSGRAVGVKDIAKHLNERGERMRGGLWGIHKVHKVLSDSTYKGECRYNVIDSRTGKKRPPSEWIRVAVEPIIDASTFERVRQRREGRRPSAVPPRRVTSPVLLSGLLKCGHCGGSMTSATGKSGRYRYYKCTTRMSKGNAHCASRNLPMEHLDELVLRQVTEQVLTPQRLLLILKEARKLLRARGEVDRKNLGGLQKQLQTADMRLNRLYEGVESGVLTLDDTLQRRVQEAKAAREAVLVEIAGARYRETLPSAQVFPSQVERFSAVFTKKLADRSSDFAKEYLRVLVDAVVVRDRTAIISGSHERLISAIAEKKRKPDQVPSSMHGWRTRRDSNSRPPAS